MIEIPGRAQNFLAVLSILATASCAPVALYQDTPIGSPSATLVFHKGYTSRLTVSASQVQLISNTASCEDLAEIPYLSSVTADTRTARVPASRPIMAQLGTVYFYTRSVGMINGSPVANVGNDRCLATLDFTPDEGHTYHITQKSSLGGPCEVTVVDAATARAPGGLSVSPTWRCPLIAP